MAARKSTVFRIHRRDCAPPTVGDTMRGAGNGMALPLAALALLVPLLIAPGVLFHYDITPKIVILSLLTAGFVALPRQVSEGVAALWRKRAGRRLCGLAAAQVLWYAVATGLSSRPWFSLLGSNWRRMGLLTVAALCVFTVLAAAHLSKTPDALSTLLRVLAVATIVASVYGIFQYFDIDPLQPASAYHAEAGDSVIVRPPGTLGHADYFGWWLAIALFCALAMARIEAGAGKWLAWTACVLAGTAIVLSGTRSAILAVACGLAVMGVLSGFRPGRKHIPAGLLLAGLLTAFYFSPGGTRLRARVRWSGDEPVGGARPLLWRDSMRMAGARPWTGYGPETFAAEFPRFQSVELSRLLPAFYHESPHNTPIDALVSEGIPGLLLALAWAFLGGYAVASEGTEQSGTRAALAGALAASCTASLFGAATAGPIFTTLLVIATLVGLSQNDTANPRTAVKPWLVSAAFAPVAVCLAVYGLALARADYDLEQFVRGTDTASSIRSYDSAVRASLPGASEDLYCSRRLAKFCGGSADPTLRSACMRTAIQAAARATATADNPPNAWYSLAMFSAQDNDAAEVETALRTSLRLAPDWFKPHWALAQLLAFTGRGEEARRESERAFVLDGGKDVEVARTLRQLTPSREGR
jgi:O-antigen ligase